MREEVIHSCNKEILRISEKHKLSHLGSCFTALPIIYDIFCAKQPNDKFILSSGHAGLALYVVLQHFYPYISAEELLIKHGIHPERDIDNHIYVSTGSLGLGITISVGIALGNFQNKVYCLISDGECAEGSVWESLAFISDNNISNIEIHANINGLGAYRTINKYNLVSRLKSFYPEIITHITDVNEVIQFPTPLSAHYLQANQNMEICLDKTKM